MGNPISIEVKDVGSTTVVIVDGELDLATVPLLKANLDEIGVDHDVIVDCAGIEFIDSTGLNLLVTQATVMRKAGGSLRLRHVSDPVQRILKLSGLVGLIEQVGPRRHFSRPTPSSGR